MYPFGAAHYQLHVVTKWKLHKMPLILCHLGCPSGITKYQVIQVFFSFDRYHHTAAINLVYALRESLALLSEEVWFLCYHLVQFSVKLL